MPKRTRSRNLGAYRNAGVRRAVRKRLRSTAARVTRQVVRRALMNPRAGGLIGLEHKYYDNHINRGNPFSPAAAFTWYHIPANDNGVTQRIVHNEVPQGDGPSDRDGRRIAISRIDVRLRWFVNASATSPFLDQALVRVIMFVDKQTNGAVCADSEPLQSFPAPDVTGIEQFYDLSQVPSRFTILADKTYRLQDPATVYTGVASAIGLRTGVMRLSHAFRTALQTNFIGTTASVNNIQDTSIHVIVCTNFTDLSIVSDSRIRFRG